MRFVWLKYAVITVFLSVVSAVAQTNPHTGIRWPAPSCSTSPTAVYNYATNVCIEVIPGPQVDPSTTINWPANCSSSNFMTYNVLTNSCFNGAVQIAAGTTTTLAPGSPATVTQTGTFPNYVLNFGIPAGIPGGSLSYPGVTSNGSGLNMTGPANSSAVSAGEFSAGNLHNLSVIGEGESTIAGALNVCSSAPYNPTSQVCNFNHDEISVLIRSDWFKNRVAASINGGVGGTTCAQMTTNWASHNLVNWAPGGSSANGATQAIDIVQTGINDAVQGTSLASFQNCMLSHLLNDVTAHGISPFVLTEYYTGAQPYVSQVMDTYNDWIRSLSGRTMNGQVVHMIDAAALLSKVYTGWRWELPYNPTNTVYPVTSYSITNTAGTSTLTFTTTASTIQTGNLTTYSNVECGGFGTSTFLNYAKGVYASGAGTQTVTLTLVTPFPTTATTTEAGMCWSYTQQPGLHLGIDGTKWMGETIADEVGLSLLRSPRRATQDVSDFDTPSSGAKVIYGQLSVAANRNSMVTDCPLSAPRPGAVCSVVVPENLPGGTSTPGWYPGTATYYFGGRSIFLNSTPTLMNFQGGVYTGAAGAIGSLVVNAPGSNYAINDTFTVANGGSAASATVTAITVAGNCVYATSSVVKGPACAAQVTAGGSGNTAANGVATTTTSGTGSGLTVNLSLSVSQSLKLNFAGSQYIGGSWTACATSTNCPAADTTGWLYSSFSTNGGGVKFGGAASADFLYSPTSGGPAANEMTLNSGSGVTVTAGGSTYGIALAAPVNHTGTAQTAANITASTGWGTSGAAGNGIGGVLGAANRFRFQITAAGTPTANPTFTANFPRAFSAAPVCEARMVGGTGTNANVNTGGGETTTSTGTFTYVGTPVAGSTYLMSVTCL